LAKIGAIGVEIIGPREIVENEDGTAAEQ